MLTTFSGTVGGQLRQVSLYIYKSSLMYFDFLNWKNFVLSDCTFNGTI